MRVFSNFVIDYTLSEGSESDPEAPIYHPPALGGVPTTSFSSSTIPDHWSDNLVIGLVSIPLRPETSGFLKWFNIDVLLK